MAHSNKTVTRPEQGVQKLNAGPSAHEKQSSPEPLDAERSFDSRPFTSAVSWDIGRMPIDPPEFAVRPEVRICDPNDPLEREAEMSNPAAMKASTPRAGGVEAPPIVHSALEREGKPLGNSVRNRMESYFGHDFSRVRIHDDPLAAESANSIQRVRTPSATIS